MSIKAARTLIEQSRYKEVFQLIDQLSETEKNSKEALFIRGCAHHATGNKKAAEQDWKDAISQDADDPALLNKLGTMYYDQKNYRKAAQYFSRLAKNGNANHLSWYYLAECLLGLNLIDDGCKAIGLFIKTLNQNEAAYNKACQLLIKWQKDKQLVDLAGKAANLFKNTSTFSIYQAQAYIKLSLYKEAQKCLQNNPIAKDTTTGQLYLGICHLRLDNLTESNRFINLILKKDANNVSANILKGQILYRQGKSKDALDIWTNTFNTKKGRNNPELLFWLSKYYHQNTSNTTKVIQLIKQELDITNGAREESHFILITSLLAAADFSGAKEAFIIAQSKFPLSVQIESLKIYMDASSCNS